MCIYICICIYIYIHIYSCNLAGIFDGHRGELHCRDLHGGLTHACLVSGHALVCTDAIRQRAESSRHRGFRGGTLCVEGSTNDRHDW